MEPGKKVLAAFGAPAGPVPLAGQLRSLLAVLRPVRLQAQLVHGDLGGNVLFAAGEPPAVIDFSPYWRPPGLALAVAAVDALMWSGAAPVILDELAGQPELDQLLARAGVPARHRDHLPARRRGRPRGGRTGQPAGDRPGPGPPGRRVRIR